MPDKKQVLFVDDEPRVLDGLRRMLRGMREEWDMTFADSGEEALKILESAPFDVVVSDMRMPGMDGAELLTRVMEQYPQTVRIVLSGHADKEMILKTVRPAHQYLSKPCDPDKLRSTVARASALRGLLADESLKQLISRMSTLPSAPSLYVEVMEELRSEEGSVKRVAGIVSKDVGMTAKILQMVNSAFFGVPRHVESPAQAVNLLGLETIKALVLSVQVFSRAEEKKLHDLSLDHLWDHSMTTGALARQIASMEGQEKAVIEDSFMAGLLHDSGKLVLAVNLPDPYREAIDCAQTEGITLWEAEQRVLKTTHSEVGAYLMGLWGLPDPIVEAIGFHHCPAECPDSGFTALTAVHAADALVQAERSDAGPTPPGIDGDYMARLGLTGRTSAWRECAEALTPEGAVDA